MSIVNRIIKGIKQRVSDDQPRTAPRDKRPDQPGKHRSDTAPAPQPRTPPVSPPVSPPVGGIMFVSKPRGAKDNIVRTAQTREEAQKLAKETALIVENKSVYLPRSGVSVRSRRHVIFDFKYDLISVEMSLTSETDMLRLQISRSSQGIGEIKTGIPAAHRDMPAKRRDAHIATLQDAIESLSLIKLTGPAFVEGAKLLQDNLDALLQTAREKIDARQRPYEAEVAATAAFQKHLDQLPTGTFVIENARGWNVGQNTGRISIHDGLHKLKRGERRYALTRRHADMLSAALVDASAHARLTAMRLLEKIPQDHPAALPPEMDEKFIKFVAVGDLLARLETLQDMSEEETIGQVFLVNPTMIDTYSSYRLPYGYTYEKTPWDYLLSNSPLQFDIARKSLPKRPAADLITLDGVLCVSEKAKTCLETLNIGSAKFHYIDGTDDYWAMEITDVKEGPVPDDGLYEVTKDGNRRPLDNPFDHKGLDVFSKRARFGPADLEGPDVWLCDDLTLGYRSGRTVMLSQTAIKALKQAKCKWHKRVYPVRVVD